MSDKYTPTTDEVRTCAEGDTPYTSLEEGAFDRWLDKERAKAQVEALREAAAETERKRSEPGLVHLDVLYQGYYTGIRSGMESAMRLLREASDRIAREAGIDTGESND